VIAICAWRAILRLFSWYTLPNIDSLRGNCVVFEPWRVHPRTALVAHRDVTVHRGVSLLARSGAQFIASDGAMIRAGTHLVVDHDVMIEGEGDPAASVLWWRDFAVLAVLIVALGLSVWSVAVSLVILGVLTTILRDCVTMRAAFVATVVVYVFFERWNPSDVLGTNVYVALVTLLFVETALGFGRVRNGGLDAQ
jgi:hypothetical protein